MKNYKTKKLVSILLTIVMVISMLPLNTITSMAAEGFTVTDAQTVADVNTAHSYEHMLGTDDDGNRYAGRIWTDKSVFDTVTNKTVSLDGSMSVESNSNFMAVFSALGSTTEVTTTTTISRPLDVVLIMDTSQSMSAQVTVGNQRMTRLQAVVNAADSLLGSLTSSSNNRIGMVTFDDSSTMLLPLDHYESADLTLQIGGGSFNPSYTVRMSAEKTNGQSHNQSVSANAMATNLQAGIYEGMNMLSGTSVTGRTPVVIILADGEANNAVRSNWHNPGTDNLYSGQQYMNAYVATSTLLTAGYMTARIEDTYGANPMVYAISVDIEDSQNAPVVMNPENLGGNNNSTPQLCIKFIHLLGYNCL